MSLLGCAFALLRLYLFEFVPAAFRQNIRYVMLYMFSACAQRRCVAPVCCFSSKLAWLLSSPSPGSPCMHYHHNPHLLLYQTLLLIQLCWMSSTAHLVSQRLLLCQTLLIEYCPPDISTNTPNTAATSESRGPRRATVASCTSAWQCRVSRKGGCGGPLEGRVFLSLGVRGF